MSVSGGMSFDESIWDHKEFEWTGKTFFYVPLIHLFSQPLGLGNKLVSLNRELRTGGYKTVNSMILIKYAPWKGRAMVEVTKLDKYDADLVTYEIPTTALTLVYRGDSTGISQAVNRLKEMVYARKSMEPREIYYLYVPGAKGSNSKTILFALV